MYSGTCVIRHLSFPTSCDIRTKIYGPKVFLLTKTKPEYSDFLYNPTLFPGPLVCRNRQVPLYLNLMKIRCLLYLINYVFFFGDTLNI